MTQHVDNTNQITAIQNGLDSVIPPTSIAQTNYIVNSLQLDDVQAKNNIMLHPEELALTHKMSKKRFNDFKAGRTIAKQLLLHYQIEDYPILINQNRAPIWPKSILGSISHSDNICIVAILKKGNIKGFGIDIESNSPISNDILKLICNDSEISDLKRLELSHQINPLVLGKLIFSIKESIFKSLNPLINCWIDFKEYQIEIDLNNNCYSATPCSKNAIIMDIGEVNGQWFSNEYFHISSCWL